MRPVHTADRGTSHHAISRIEKIRGDNIISPVTVRTIQLSDFPSVNRAIGLVPVTDNLYWPEARDGRGP